MSERIKNVFITLLILLAIYQTFTLWLISIPTTNSVTNFSNLFNISKKINYDNKEDYFIPSKIITNNNNKYYLQYSQLQYDSKLTLIKNSISLTDSFSPNTFDLSLYNEDFISLNFNIYLNESILEEVFNKNYKNLNDFYFNTIHLSKVDDYLLLSLINLDTKEIYTTAIQSSSLIDSYLRQVSINNHDLYYNLVLNEIGEISFIPTWDINILTYNNVTLSNPYLSTVGILKNELTEKVTPLFNNAKNKVASTVDNNIVVISDAYNVAKYYPTDILEYSYYKNTPSSKSTIYEDFITAYEYILNDPNFNNEFYLSNYTFEDGKSTFYFDYVANNLPILLTPSYKKELGINSFLEISVSNNAVVYYKLLVYNYETSNETSNYSRNKLLNDMTNMTYDNLSMGYYLEIDDTLILYWLLTNEDNILIKSVK